MSVATMPGLSVAILNLALFGLYYWGVQYGAPAWNVHSFPPPLVH